MSEHFDKSKAQKFSPSPISSVSFSSSFNLPLDLLTSQIILLWKSYYGYYKSLNTTLLETHRMRSTNGLEHYQGSNSDEGQKPLQCSRGPQTPKQKEWKRISLCSSTRMWNSAQMHSSHTIFFSVLSLTWFQELAYSWDMPSGNNILKAYYLQVHCAFPCTEHSVLHFQWQTAIFVSSPTTWAAQWVLL